MRTSCIYTTIRFGFRLFRCYVRYTCRGCLFAFVVLWLRQVLYGLFSLLRIALVGGQLVFLLLCTVLSYFIHFFFVFVRMYRLFWLFIHLCNLVWFWLLVKA